MKSDRHKRKESFSVLLISNTGLDSKQIHISRSILRFVVIFILLVCIVCGFFTYQYWNGYQNDNRSRNGDEGVDASSNELLEKIASQEEQMRQLEAEKAELNSKNDALTTENKALLEAAKTNMGIGKTEEGNNPQEEGAQVDVPGLYPCSEQGDVSGKYTQDHPYISIDTSNGGSVIASGDGKIVRIGSDDTYPLIIEIEHEGGYQTRYMFVQEAEALQEEGAQVQAGDTLVTLDANNTQLDYQVIYEEQPIDPLDVFEAKG